jgi:hypothetical protein
MFDGGAELAGLLFDVVSSFSDGLFRARVFHLVWRVTSSLMVLLDHLGPVHLALLLGFINAVMVGRQPRVAQILVLVVVEVADPVAPPFFLVPSSVVTTCPVGASS